MLVEVGMQTFRDVIGQGDLGGRTVCGDKGIAVAPNAPETAVFFNGPEQFPNRRSNAGMKPCGGAGNHGIEGIPVRGQETLRQLVRLNLQVITAENAAIGQNAHADLQVAEDTGVTVLAIDINDIEMTVAQVIADLAAGGADMRCAAVDVGESDVVTQGAIGQFVAQEIVHNTREIRCAGLGVDLTEGLQRVDGKNASVAPVEGADAMGPGEQRSPTQEPISRMLMGLSPLPCSSVIWATRNSMETCRSMGEAKPHWGK